MGRPRPIPDPDPTCPPARVDAAIRFVEALCELRAIDAEEDQPGTILPVPADLEAANRAALQLLRRYFDGEDACAPIGGT